MEFNGFPDNIHLFVVLIALIAILLLFIESGYRLGSGRVQNKAQISQVRAIMGASLGLVAFMMAFTFSMAHTHFEDRTEGLVFETNVITQTYRAADLLEEPVHSQARRLLMDFVDLRIETGAAAAEGRLSEVGLAIEQSEQIHEQLWGLATGPDIADSDGRGLDMFTSSVVELMNTHTTRLEAVLYNRIPSVIWLSLLFMTCLSMLTMGYQAGLTAARSQFATWTLAIAFSSVMVLIMDLDRPIMTLFDVNDQIMIDLRARMSTDVG